MVISAKAPPRPPDPAAESARPRREEPWRSGGGGGDHLGHVSGGGRRSAAPPRIPCPSVAAAAGEEEEEVLVPFAIWRVLASMGGYISYAALRRDSVPCSQRGASYYNCHPDVQANPYSRGCSAITHCRSS